VRPAVLVGHLLERQGDPEIRPNDAHHGVVGLGVVQITVAAPFRKERTVPVGHEVPGNYAYCIQQSNPPAATHVCTVIHKNKHAMDFQILPADFYGNMVCKTITKLHLVLSAILYYLVKIECSKINQRKVGGTG